MISGYKWGKDPMGVGWGNKQGWGKFGKIFDIQCMDPVVLTRRKFKLNTCIFRVLIGCVYTWILRLMEGIGGGVTRVPVHVYGMIYQQQC